MYSSVTKNFSRNNLLNLIVACFPISFIAGNTIINLNIVLIILLSIIFYKKDIFNIKYFLIDKLIILYFLFILYTGFYNDIYFIVNDLYPAGYKTILKSLFYLRYLFLYFAIRYLIEKEILNLKLFFLSCSFCSIFVCVDIFLKHFSGKIYFD